MHAGIVVAGAVLAASVTGAAVAPGAALADPAQPRAYELVSPADKSASDVTAGAVATADGNAVAYTSFGTLADSPTADFATIYRGVRGPTGWTTTVLSPRQVLPNRTSLATSINPQDFSADLSTFYGAPFSVNAPLLPEDLDDSVDVYAGTDGGETHWLTPGVDPTASGDSVYAGRSDDGRVVVFESSKQILPSVPGGTNEVYALVDGAPRLVSLVDDGTGTDEPAPGGAQFGGGRTVPYNYAPPDRRAVSADGSRVFFTSGGQLYARIDGTRTVLVSASRATGSVGDPAPTGATFAGASDDGRYVTFISPDALVDGAGGGGLYGYDLDARTLRLLAETDLTIPAGTVRTAPDGSRVYFVGYHQLDGDGTDGEPNLWVARADGTRHFIATLDAADAAIALGAGENQNLAAVTGDGRRLAFDSAAHLGRYDSGGATEVYIYDDGDQRITCVSCPAGGDDPVGNASLRDPNNTLQVSPRSFTTSGGLFFETPQRLSADDTDDQVDVYEYTAGRARLVSTATTTETHYIDNSADGGSVFLRTRDSLVSADDDHGYMDVYVARAGGGFPAAATPGCVGSDCRPAPTPDPPPAGAPPSATAFDLTPGVATATRPTFTVTPVSAAARRAFARTGRLALRVRVSAAAVLTATGRGQLGRKRATVASGSVNKLGAGRTTLTVRLTTAARRALARSGRLTVRLAIACSDTPRTAHATLVLHHVKTIKKGR